MSYTVLARRYRSTCFAQVIGQEPIAKTLGNAIASDRVAHAYLFTGTRGVGKTSMARILACALNAPDTVPDCPKTPATQATNQYQYPTLEVQQRMAKAIMRGDDMNVIEIDGASNRSVDEARQLIANAGLSPTANARFKIYIIDEVHMLTREAFNTLLKTMEEPPPHVKFILCTTEPRKIPPTIQSRCQRFDFGNIPTARIVDHLKVILEKETIQADPQAVWQIARLGNGSMRDALTLMDRLIAACVNATDPKNPTPSTLTLDTLEQILGLPPQDLMLNLVDALAQGDVPTALKTTADLLQQGIAQDQLLQALIEHLRQLMLITACGPDTPLVELADTARDEAVRQSKQFDAPGLVYMIALCENLQQSVKASPSPRALLDATIVRLALAEKMADVAAILSHSPTQPNRLPSQPEQKKKPPSHQSPPPPPAVTSQDPTSVWSALLKSIHDQPSASWIRRLKLHRLEDTVAHIDTQPGSRDLRQFVNQQRKDQLAKLFTSVLHRPIRVQWTPLAATPIDRTDPQPPGSTKHHYDPFAGATIMQSASQLQRQQVLKLPLVKQVFDQFDATILDVRTQANNNHTDTPTETPLV